MTNNINGIDVSECSFSLEHEGKQKCATGFGVICDCENLYNCYFKQLKRLEQREKSLNKIADDLQKRNHDLTLTNEQLEQENKGLQMLSCANCGEKYLTPDGAELYDKNVQLQKENDKLKAEIKNNKTALQTELGVYNMECGNLLKENEELLDENKKYKQQIEAYQLSENESREIIAELEYKNKDYLKQLDALKPENVYLHKTIKKYEQTLKEIKEISEPVKKDICNNCGWQDSDDCEHEGCSCNEFITILHKINEVINEK